MKDLIYYICALVCVFMFCGTSCNFNNKQNVEHGDMQCDSMSTQRLCDTVACIENFKQDIIEDSIATVKDITPDESAECFLDSLQAMRERLHLYDRDYDSFDRWAHLWHGFSEKPTMHEFVLLCTLFIDCKSEAEVSGVRERQYPYLIEHPDFFENVSVWFNAMPKELRYDFLRNLRRNCLNLIQ